MVSGIITLALLLLFVGGWIWAIRPYGPTWPIQDGRAARSAFWLKPIVGDG